MFDIQMGFTVPPHIPSISEMLSTRGAGKLACWSPTRLADHTVQDSWEVYT